MTIYQLLLEYTDNGQETSKEILRCQINDKVYSVEDQSAVSSIESAIKAVCDVSVMA